jgi:hypothetical protein
VVEKLTPTQEARMTDSERDRLGDLIAKLEAAPKGAGKLDVEIDLAVNPNMKQPAERMDPTLFVGNRFGYEHSPPRYTTSLDAALTLVPNRCDVGNIGWDPSGNACSLQEFSNGHVHSVAVGYAVTLPLAVCIAALKARREGGDHE